MTLTLTQSATACGPGRTVSFQAISGTSPFVYSVVPGGAGGIINASTGIYTAPNTVGTTPQTLYDVVVVTDDDANTASAKVLVGSPLLLFCEILQSELGLAEGRVYLWDQKIMQPADNGLYVAVSVPSCKPFANANSAHDPDFVPYVSMLARVDIDVISRGVSARDRKEEVILALNSTYAQQQQEANGFYIAKISTNFINLSEVDGAAIPYRYKVSVNMQYRYSKAQNAQYFDTFAYPTVTTED